MFKVTSFEELFRHKLKIYEDAHFLCCSVQAKTQRNTMIQTGSKLFSPALSSSVQRHKLLKFRTFIFKLFLVMRKHSFLFKIELLPTDCVITSITRTHAVVAGLKSSSLLCIQ